MKEFDKLHRSFGNPSVTYLFNLLWCAKLEQEYKTLRYAIEDLVIRYRIWKKISRKPWRLKLTLGIEDDIFNHTAAVDIIHIDGEAVFHIIDEYTHFTASRCADNVSASTVWLKIALCWINTYSGPPDHISRDESKYFVWKKFKRNADSYCI